MIFITTQTLDRKYLLLTRCLAIDNIKKMEDFTMIKIMLIKTNYQRMRKIFLKKMNPGFSVTGDVLC